MPRSPRSAERTVEGTGAAILAALREGSVPRVDNDTPLVPGLFLSWDGERAAATFEVRTGACGAIRIEGRIEGAPRWVSLNLELGAVDFAPGDLLCVAADLEGSGGETALQILCRSFREAGARDTVLDEGLILPDGRLAQLALHRFAPGDAAVGGRAGVGAGKRGARHTLIVLLPVRDFAVSIHDLRLRAGPAAGHGIGDPTLSGLAGL